MYNLASIRIFTDGGSRGNPGPSALGTYIEGEDGKEIASIGRTLGITTNNVAEYSAIREGMLWIMDNLSQMPSLVKINFFMDSNLAASQLNGFYRIKNPGLREIYFEIKTLESQIKIPITYQHIPREENKKADRLVNLALDNKLYLA
jgi:ribonuclease HI